MLSPFAKELMEDLALSMTRTQDEFVKERLDVDSDVSEDEKGGPVCGQEILTQGKYGKDKNQKKTTFKEVYRQDKNYIQWIRAHVDLKSSAPMKRFRLYVEWVDTQKKLRIQKKWNPGQGSSEQMPVPPMSMTLKNNKADHQKSAYNQAVDQAANDILKRLDEMGQSSRRRHREGGGWGDQKTRENPMDDEEEWEGLGLAEAQAKSMSFPP